MNRFTTRKAILGALTTAAIAAPAAFVMNAHAFGHDSIRVNPPICEWDATATASSGSPFCPPPPQPCYAPPVWFPGATPAPDGGTDFTIDDRRNYPIDTSDYQACLLAKDFADTYAVLVHDYLGQFKEVDEPWTVADVDLTRQIVERDTSDDAYNAAAFEKWLSQGADWYNDPTREFESYRQRIAELGMRNGNTDSFWSHFSRMVVVPEVEPQF